VPIDHQIFQDINAAQWLWYHNNIMQDEKENFEEHRDFTEYLAGFIEPEAVKKIKEARSSGQSVSIDDEKFAKGIESIFGRKISFDKNSPKQALNQFSSTGDVIGIMKGLDNMRPREKDQSVLNYKHWSDIKLE